MGWLRLLGALCLGAVPALATPTTYVFEVTSGAFLIDVLPNNFVTPDPVDVPLGGTFTVTIDDDDGQLGAGDTFTLGSANIYNSEESVLNFVPHSGTATFAVGGARILDFQASQPGQIFAGGVGTIDPLVFVTANLTVAGVTGFPSWMNGYWEYASWTGVAVETFNLAFDVLNGIPVGVTLDGELAYTWMYAGWNFGDFSQSVQIQGSVVPDPGCLGLIALGLGAAATGLRRRRRG